MSILETVTKPENRPVIMTVLGDAGTGKTTLAASFPKPLFIRLEDGLQALPLDQRPDALPKVTGSNMLFDQLGGVLKEEHDYKTLVLDSVTAAERLFIKEVIESDPKNPKSINQALGGYGAGINAVAAMHQRVRHACGIINERRGMHIIFIAHADLEKIDLPDQDAYTRYSLRLGKHSMAPYIDDSDLVGFLKLRTFTKPGSNEDGPKKAISDGGRILVAYATAANVSKNRYGITSEIDVIPGKNPLAGIIPSIEE